MINLSKDSVDLLLKCLENHRPDLLREITNKSQVNVNEDIGNELRDAVGDELMQNGLEGDSPNEYGLKLEKLIDDIGRMFM